MSKQKSVNKKNKVKSKVNGTFVLMLTCFGIETAVFFIACIAALIADVKSNSFYIFSMISLCLGCLGSGFVSVRKTKKNGLLNGIFYALPANVFYIVISLFFNSFKIDYFIIISLLLLVLSSAIGGVLSVNFKPKTKIKAKR